MLIHGDCIEEMAKLDAGSIDLVLTDPPYGTTACKWDSVIPFEPMWEQLKRIIKPNGAIVLTASQPFTSALIMSNIKMFKYCWVWEKSQATGHLNAWKQPMRNTEDIVVFYKKQCNYNPQIEDKPVANIRPNTGRTNKNECYGKMKNGPETRRLPIDKSMPKTIQKFNCQQGNMHPTQKPVALMEYLIKTYTNEGETVLDFTAGSFTTGVACYNTNRDFIGIERDEKYFEIGKNRMFEAAKCLGLKTELEIHTGGLLSCVTLAKTTGGSTHGSVNVNAEKKK